MAQTQFEKGRGAVAAALWLSLGGCGSDQREAKHEGASAVVHQNLERRAYIVSRDSEELTVIDLDHLEIIAKTPLKLLGGHMAELNRDYTKVYVDSSETNETVVVDAASMKVMKRIVVGLHPTHLSLSRDGSLLAVMSEGEDAVSFIDPTTDREIKRIGGFYTPHFMRFSPDGNYGYVANIGAHHITRVDLSKLEIDKHIVLDGFKGPPDADLTEGEQGFGDVQIDQQGVLFAAHSQTGLVLAYDTVADAKYDEIKVGDRPWMAYVEHPFVDVPLRHFVTNFGSKTLSVIDGKTRAVMASLPGDEEAYGVNYNSVRPDLAFVMNRIREDVAVVDTKSNTIIKRIDVGGNTETASTTADGELIVAAVSGANRVVIIDARTQTIRKIFENVGRYPWSVTIPGGQNYCH